MSDSHFPSIDDYLRLISHELKGPINAIKMLLDTVLEGYAGDVEERARFVIEKAARRSEEAGQIISDLLHFERYAEESDGSTESVNLSDLVRTLVDRHSADASEKGIVIDVTIPDEFDVVVTGDLPALEHALRNLIENAIKYTPDGGNVRVSMSTDAKNSTVSVAVSDSGPGISADYQKRIFQPFFRAPAQASTTAGTGLGLPIVLRVAENHKGNVQVESAVGAGATFVFTIPYAETVPVARRDAGKKIVIIGGVTAGPKTAARLRRLDESLDITIVERKRFLSYAGCGLPWYISGRVESPEELMSSGDNAPRDIRFFETIGNIRVMNNTLAERIDRRTKKVHLLDTASGMHRIVPYDVLVLATGARPVVPTIRGVDIPGVFTLRTIEDAERIKRSLASTNAHDLYIIGGGLVGISTADELLKTGARITILEKKKYILLQLFDRDVAVRIEAELRRRGIQVHTDVEVTEIYRRGDKLGIDTTSDGEAASHTADLIILSTGAAPNSELARRAGLRLGATGGVVVDRYLRTSDESIYAVGDCAESTHIVTGKAEYLPLGSVSTKMGRIAADNICGIDAEYTGSVASAMFKLREMSVARTGLTTRAAWKHGFDIETAVVTGKDRAHYDEKAADITIKVIADRKSRVILGAQGYGVGEVVARIELLAAAVWNRMTIEDFFRLDIGYAPSFNNAIDLAQTACLLLANKLDGIVRTIHPDKLDELEGVALVSVSPPHRAQRFEIGGSLNIPLERLRRDRFPYDRSRRIVLYSRTSTGAYSAYRYLISRGYTELGVLEGGFLFYQTRGGSEER